MSKSITKCIFVMIFIILLLPVYFMLMGSLQNTKGVMSMPPRFWPRILIADNYVKIMSWPILKWLTNTFIVFSCAVVLSMSLSLMAGYVFTFYDFPLKKTIWLFMLIGIMIPRISLLIPMYVVIKKLGISGTLLAVILSTAFSPMGMYLARTYFTTIPTSLIESARIDGANEWQILRKVVVPVSKPIATTLALFAGISALQDYIWQMLILQNELKQTMLIGMMREVMRRGGSDLNLNPMGRSMAVGIVLLLPLLIIFLVANKYFIESIDGAVKE